MLREMYSAIAQSVRGFSLALEQDGTRSGAFAPEVWPTCRLSIRRWSVSVHHAPSSSSR